MGRGGRDERAPLRGAVLDIVQERKGKNTERDESLWSTLREGTDSYICLRVGRMRGRRKEGLKGGPGAEFLLEFYKRKLNM